MRTEEDERRLSILRWGLIPGWAKEPNIGYKLINARSETASSKPAFRAAFRARRCLIPVDGFYEWTGKGASRQPWLIEMKDGSIFAFAGLWERWTIPPSLALKGSLAELAPGDRVETCTVLTTAANEAVRAVHNRMPVILPPERFDAWLAGENVPLDPYPARAIRIQPRQHPRQHGILRQSALHRANRPVVRRQPCASGAGC